MKYLLEIASAAVLVAVLAVFLLLPLVTPPSLRDTGDGGAADIQVARTLESNGYAPWVRPVWEPDPAMASLLLMVQTALAALVIGYFFGYYRGKRREVP